MESLFKLGFRIVLKPRSIKTNHMKARQKQRGICDEVVDLLYTYGRSSYNRRCWITDFDTRSMALMRKENPAISQSTIDKLTRCYLIEIDGVEVTVAYKKKGWSKRFGHGKPRRRAQI